MNRHGRAGGASNKVRPVESHSHRNSDPEDPPLQDNPLAPLVAQWPPPTGPVPLLPQAVGVGFLGATLGDSGDIPPDSMGAVGPTQVIVIVNGVIRLFSKGGGTQSGLNTSTDSFFASVRGGSGTSDPHIRYDRLTGRWFVVMINVANHSNRILIAVSSDSTITPSSSFTFFEFQQDFDGGDAGLFADYPTLGVDRFALYIGVNNFLSSSGGASTRTGFVVNKASLLSGGPIVVTPFRNLDNDGLGNGIKTPQGVDNDDPTATEGYFIGVDAFTSGKLDIRRISDPGGSPSISPSLTVTVPATAAPIGQSHKADTLHKKLDPVSDRLFAAAMHKNKLTGTNTLSTAHNLEVDSTGVAVSGGGRNGSRWYEIGEMTNTPVLIQAGTLFDSATSNPKGYWIPSVAISGQGHMALGCSYAASNVYAGVAVSGRLRTDPPGSTQQPTFAVVSANAYNISETNTFHRWGDFSQVVIDPTDDMTMWTFQEYCNADDSWGVRAIQLKAPPPATPMSASPSSLLQGQTADVAITGTSIGGSEFFDAGSDPGGPGYSNHLTAAVNGGGVTVNSVTFLGPTNFSMNVTVATNVTAGMRTITVTNPDGHPIFSGSILTINTPPSITTPPADQSVAQGSDATFTVTAGGTTPLSYQWRFNQVEIQTAISSSYTRTNPQCADAGLYDVVVTNSLGSQTSSVANFTVVAPPILVLQPTNQSVLVGQSFAFFALATNQCGGGISYQWQLNGTNLSGATSNAYTSASAQLSDAGGYTVLITNLASMTSAVASLTVIGPPVVGFTAGPTSGVAPLSVSFTNFTTSATNYLWDFGDGNTSPALNPVNIFTNTGVYSVRLTAVGPAGTSSLTRTNYILALGPAQLVLSPATINFGSVFTNLSAQSSFVISNSGGNLLSATATVTAGPFALLDPSSNSAASLSFDVPSLNTTNIAVIFAPLTVGSYSNAVAFSSNGGNPVAALLGQGASLPVILSPGFDGTSFSFSFQTVSGKTYIVQYKNSLNDPIWQTLATLPGDGTNKTVSSSTPSSAQVFYRLSVQ
jgi:PKD repeat protein